MKQPIIRFDKPSFGPEISSFMPHMFVLFHSCQGGRTHVESSEI